MPTDEIVNASEQTVITPPATPDITDDLIKSHPLYKDLETKHAAARTGMDTFAVENKRLKKLVVGEEEAEALPPPAFATKDDIQQTKEQIKWEILNEKPIELADKNGLYSKLLSEGRTAQDALDLALYREGFTGKSNTAEQMRQAAAAAPSAGVDRSDPNSPVEGISKAYVDGLKAKGLKEEDIRDIVKNAQDRAAKRS